MAIDGIVLNKITTELSALCPFKINKINHLSDSEILFTCKSSRQKFQLLISCHSVYNRLQITSHEYRLPSEPTAFVMLLRKHIEDATVIKIAQLGLDRVVQFDLRLRNDLGDSIEMTLYIELMGKYANVILVDSDNRIVDALKRIPPFENNRRTITPTAQYVPIDAHDKKDPFTVFSIDPHEPIAAQFHGFSPLLGREVEHRLMTSTFESVMTDIKNSDKLYIHEKDFHIIPLTHLNQEAKVMGLMEGLDEVHHRKEENERIKQHTGDLIRFINKEIKKNESKLIKLQESLDEAFDCDKYRVYGDHLLTYGYLVKKGMKQLEVTNFETEAPMMIPLDEKQDLKGNIRKTFQKYTKGKKGQEAIANQIQLTQNEIEYFRILSDQIVYATLPDALEIRQELSEKGYLKAITDKRRKKATPAYNHLTLDNGVQLYYGKNNIQNDLITFKLAKRNDVFVHVKDFHGAHVIIAHPEPDESTLRSAAQIALYYSKARHSGTVGINYTPIHQVKKIPSGNLGLVSLGHYKTIYIDPDEALLKKLLGDKYL
jgi:predicted ribosome quality control (RQC) complex YloA/Tae2 family protein